jgi:FkbM family methyltransferase
MSVVSAARNVLAEFRVCAQSPDDFRAQAFTRYLQMQARVILGRRFPRAYPMPKSSRIFGRTWSCPNYEAALGIFKEVFVAGEYHFAASSPNPVVVDAGANIGLASLYFHLLYPECRVVAFEPDVAAFSALRQNVQANGLNVQCVNAGLWALEGTHTIYTDPSNEAGVSASMFQCSNLTTAVDIQVVQLSRYIDGPVDLLKLDVEGAETAVLKDLAQSGKLTEIRQAIVEFHPHKGQPENKLDECIGLLQERFSVEVSDVHGATMVWALAKQR